MFEKIRAIILNSAKANAENLKKGPGRPRKVEPIEAITKWIEPEEEKKSKVITKKICTIEEHNCIALQLTNRLICMIEEFEKNIDRIENHPNLNEGTKLDIQNYINKNLITAIWALSPALELMKEHKRYKTFKSIYTKSITKGVPGILDEIKHI